MKKHTAKEYAIALYEATKDVAKETRESVIRGFVELLYKEQQLKLSNAIIAEFIQYSKKQAGVVTIDITTARELDDKTINHIKQSFGNNVEATTHINPEMLGGVIIRDESTIFDASLKKQLTKLKQTLI